MSTGAWIFATAALVLGVAAPVSYAAATSTVAIGNTSNGSTAYVDGERQLVTVNGVQPAQVISGHVETAPTSHCNLLYTPPAGKGIVVTSVSYRSDNPDTSAAAFDVDLTRGPDCQFANYDVFDASQEHETQHTFPAGLPMPSLALWNGSGSFVDVTFTGYLIPASQVPASRIARRANYPRTGIPTRRRH